VTVKVIFIFDFTSVRAMTKHHVEPPVDEYLVQSKDSCLKATGRFVGYGTTLGTTAAVIVAQNPTNMTFLEVVGSSISRFIFPAALVGGVFASVTCLMDDLRGREKATSNGLIGGAVAGLVLSTKSLNPGKAASYAFMFGLAGAVGRFAATKSLGKYDPEKKMKELHNSIYLSDMRHLEPTQK